MSNVFVFRIANDIDFIKKEITEGRLRQGWGNSASNLKGVSIEEWVEKQCTRYPEEDKETNEEYYKKRYKLLSKMQEIKEGDIIIIPKTPDNNKFVVCQAGGEYTFIKPEGFHNSDGAEVDDFYHVIPIVKDSIRVFSYHANENCKKIHAKIGSYRKPVNCVYREDIIEPAKELISTAANVEEQPLEDLIKEIKKDIFEKHAIGRIRALGNRDTERITKMIFEKMGYEFIRPNSFNGEGGDADLIFADNSFGELADVSLNSSEVSGEVFVQVKNKRDIDDEDFKGVEQLINRAKDENVPVKILISTASSFTSKCIEMANQNNVLLIDGNGFLNLIFKYVV